MGNYEETFRLNLSVSVYPKQLILAHCSRCGNEVDSFAWRNSKDRIIKKKKLISRTAQCPFCKAKFCQ